MSESETSGSERDGPKRFGPVSLSGTDKDGGARLYLSEQVIAESGLEPDSAVILQPYKNGVHVIEARRAVFGEDDRSEYSDCQRQEANR